MEHESLEKPEELLQNEERSGSEASNEVPCSFSAHIGDVVSSTAHNFGQRSGWREGRRTIFPINSSELRGREEEAPSLTTIS